MWKTRVFSSSARYRKKTPFFSKRTHPESGNKLLPSSYSRIKATTASGVQWVDQSIYTYTYRNAHADIGTYA